jgi:hypothetical protein
MGIGSKTKTYVAKLHCSECGTAMLIHRRMSRARPINHKKDMWCFRCKAKRKFIESGEW